MKKIVLFLLIATATIQGLNCMKITKIIDLTHTLNAESPTWDGACGFDLPTTLDHHECTSETKFKLQALHLKKQVLALILMRHYTAFQTQLQPQHYLLKI